MLAERLSNRRVILASASPRRKQLLSGLDISFEVVTKSIDEDYPQDMSIEQIPVFLARKKAEALSEELQDKDIVLAADTVVCIENKILNKPTCFQEAEAMLTVLSGKTHKVITGVCLLSLKKVELFSDTTVVYFRNLTPKEIRYYVEQYRPYDKAGSYGAQEWLGMVAIERVEGSYFNVMGLPVHLVYEKLWNFD